jgi:anti-anti-sigma factor
MESTIICRPVGALDFNTATQLRHLVGEILSPNLDLIFDLSLVNFIDAVGASALVGSIRRVRAIGGRSGVSAVNPRIRWILDVIGIDGFLTYSTPDEPDAA